MPTPAASTYAQTKTVTDALTIEASLLAALAAAGVDLTGYDEFSLVKALVSEQATTRNQEQTLRATLAQALDPAILVTLSTDWVDVICLAIWQEPRIAALPTQGTLVVSVASGSGPYSYQAGDLLIEDTSTGTYFTNTNTAPQGATSSSPAPLTFQSQTAGAATNPGGSPTWKLISAPSGASLGLSFASWTRTQAGRDAEGNGPFVERCQAKWGTLGAGGNIDAYNYWIPTGTNAITAWWVDDSNPFGPGSIGVWLADTNGPATTPEISSVIAYLTPRKALGSGLLGVYAAPAYATTITATLVTDGTNPTYLSDAAVALNLLNKLSVLGPVLDRALVSSLLRGLPVGTIDLGLTAGGSKLVTIGAPGFGGVTGVTLSAFFPIAVPANKVLQLTPSLS